MNAESVTRENGWESSNDAPNGSKVGEHTWTSERGAKDQEEGGVESCPEER